MASEVSSEEPLAKRQRSEDENGNVIGNVLSRPDGEKPQATNEHGITEPQTTTGSPPCEKGVDCTETELIHFAEYWHPTKSDEERNQSTDESSRAEETEELQVVDLEHHGTCFMQDQATQPSFEEFSDSEEEGNGVPADQSVSSVDSARSRLSKNDTVLSRGTSILRSYSILTEVERRELIRRAFELKDMLKKELHQTLGIIEAKNQELRRVHSELERGQLMVEGEVEAMGKSDLVYFPLFAERAYKGRSAAQIHFRLAESQFYRLVDVADKYRVTKVEYVVNPAHIRRFKKARRELQKLWGDSMSYPVLAFHGTKEANINSICQQGFRVPGDANFEHATDGGNYGRGVYFSEFPSYSAAYIRGGTKLLLCQVLPGKVFRCSQLIHGSPLETGYNSHASPDGKELVIFNSHHILPSYVIHYGVATGDFQYVKADDQ